VRGVVRPGGQVRGLRGRGEINGCGLYLQPAKNKYGLYLQPAKNKGGLYAPSP